jgi:GT2 family glycosyltransferase
MAEPIATIIMPTLDLDRAHATCKLAKRTAGVECAFFVYWDFKMRGAVKSSNALFKAAMHMESPYIVYLNDDTRPEQNGWLRKLIKALEMDAKYGLACPSGECSGIQKTGKPGDPFEARVVNQPLAWFCAAVKRQVFKDIGFFDEGFIHYGDESDFVQRARRKGWKQLWVRGVYVEHLRPWKHGDDPSRPLRNQWAKHDRRRYRRKWRKGK